MKKLFFMLIFSLVLSSAKAQLYSDIRTVIPADSNSSCTIGYNAKDNSGNLIITGEFLGTIAFSGSDITLTNTNSYIPDWGPNYGAFIAKLNADGTWAWAKKINSTWYNSPMQWFSIRGVATDPSGNIFITGDFGGTAYLDNITLASSQASDGGLGIVDIFVAKMNSNGAFQWAKKEGSGKGPEFGRDISIDVAGNAIIVGSYTNKIASCGICPQEFTSDIFLAKFNSAGIKQWSKNFGNGTLPLYIGNYTNSGFTIGTDASGNIFVGGKFIGTIKFGNTSVKSHDAKKYDAFVTKFNSAGTAQWAKTGYTSDHTAIHRSSFDSSGNMYFGGRGSGGVLVFNGTSCNNISEDFIIKLNNSGSLQWYNNVGNSNYDTDDYVPRSILVNNSGNIDLLPGLDGPYMFEYSPAGNLLFTESLDNTYSGDICKNTNGVTVSLNFLNTVTLPTNEGAVTITIPYNPQNPNFGILIANFSPASPPLSFPSNDEETDSFVSQVNNIDLFPNPTSGLVSVNIPSFNNDGILRVTTLTGKELLSKKITGDQNFELDLHDQEPGMYFIQVKTHTQSWQKVVLRSE